MMPSLRRRRVELAGMFDELQRLFASEWPQVPLAVVPNGVVVDADPDLLAQLLINLLRNAAEAALESAAEAALESAAEAAVADTADPAGAPRVALSAQLLTGGRVAIDVVDNGPGIAEGLRQDVFLPFFSTKAEGTGVGLSLARQIALAHGGALRSEAIAPRGTRFRLTL
jgi:two-component system, NtrC family, nitrogen regulation sensor histidine kinase NtrY